MKFASQNSEKPRSVVRRSRGYNALSLAAERSGSARAESLIARVTVGGTADQAGRRAKEEEEE